MTSMIENIVVKIASEQCGKHREPRTAQHTVFPIPQIQARIDPGEEKNNNFSDSTGRARIST